MYSATWAVAILVALQPVAAAPTAAESAELASRAPEVMDDATFYNLTLPEYTPDGLKVIDMRFGSGLEKRAGCTQSPGIANGQCVRYYSYKGCQSQDHIKGYKPTCAGNCYVDKFKSVKVHGDGTYSTNCEMYSDTNCRNRLGSIGSKTGFGQCSTHDGWSMRCYYRC